MRLSTRALYGTRAVLDLALHKGQGLVSLKDIAQRQVDCVAKPEICGRSKLCVTRDVWVELQKVTKNG